MVHDSRSALHLLSLTAALLTVAGCDSDAPTPADAAVDVVRTDARLTDTADGHACAGIASCTAKVSGFSGQALPWKSSCGGYANTTLDGVDEPASFSCP